jgi:hypothetical protein
MVSIFHGYYMRRFCAYPMRRFCGGYAQILRIATGKQQDVFVRRLAPGFAVPWLPSDQSACFQIGKMHLHRAPGHLAKFGKPCDAREASPGALVVVIC